MPMTLATLGTKAMEMTNTSLGEELSSHTQWTKEEIKELFPTKSDKEELGKLIKIVAAATDANKKKRKLIANIASIAGAVIKVAGKSLGSPI